jgi:hypothetical protein
VSDATLGNTCTTRDLRFISRLALSAINADISINRLPPSTP